MDPVFSAHISNNISTILNNLEKSAQHKGDKSVRNIDHFQLQIFQCRLILDFNTERKLNKAAPQSANSG